MWSLLDSQPIVGFAYSALSLLFVGLAAWHALAGRETDLVEARRRLRMLLAVSAASYGAVLIVTDVVSPGSSVSAPFSIVNAAGVIQRTNYSYDKVGQLIKVTLPNNSAITYTYDDAHRLTNIKDTLGNSLAYTHDLWGNRMGEVATNPNGAFTRQIKRIYDTLNRLQQVTGAVQ